MELDRSKQKYWILRRGDPWSVRRVSEDGGDGGHVADWPAYFYDKEMSTTLCMAENDERAKELAAQAKEKVDEALRRDGQ